MQSVLAPASDAARLMSGLTWGLIAGAALIFAFVVALLARGAWRDATHADARRWIVGGGIVLPVLVLTVLLAYGLRIGSRLSHDPRIEALEIEVVARQWWWELRYRSPDGRGWVVLANELHLPLDCIANLTLLTDDVIHSFWVPALAGKVDMIPGHRNRLTLHATKPGRYRGQCAEFCGTQHANMAMEVVVESPQQFRTWLLNQAATAATPATALTRRGLQAFVEGGCGTCHAIRGTRAAGTLGPDLTHVAGRRLLAAATLPNEPDVLAGWIRGAQHLKPGNLMPSMPVFDEAELRALAAYLGSLH
jgi:cytochrome c oxidase subunit 2